MMTRFSIALTLIFGFALSATAQDSPNIVIVFADDLGYGDLSSYGHPSIHTPHLDGMAADGIKLTAFYMAAAACSPSRAALLTGRYPMRSGMSRVLGPDAEHGLPADEITLAEALKAQGYKTAAFGKWHLGGTDGFFPTQNGFDEYYGLLYSNDMMPPWVNTERPLRLYRGTEPVDEYPVDQTTITRRYTEEAVRFIREADGEPFFVYLPHSMPHLPVYASEPFAGTSKGGDYGDVIEEIDWSVGQILEALDEEGLAENTIVVFTSDNGPWTNMPPRMYDTEEHIVERWHAGTVGPLRGSKHTTWEGGHRVPGIVRWPARIPEAQVSAEVVTAMDLYTTLLLLAGADVPQDRPVDGEDVTAVLTGEGPSPHEVFYYFRNESLEAIRDEEWKLHIRPETPDGPRVELLFNLVEDPYETFNVADAHPEVVERLKARMTAFAEEIGAEVGTSEP